MRGFRCHAHGERANTSRAFGRVRLLWGGLLLLGVLAAPATAAAVCGDAILDPSEECDPGGGTYVDGDPANGSCSTGGDCFYEFSCCKFNCQFVGEGATCFDDNPCTTADQCDQVGNCGGNNVPDGGLCDDGLFCTVGDQCTAGVCSGPAYDCSDSNVCTDDSCNEAADSCSNVPNAVACDDGLFCSTGDQCSGGACSGTALSCDDSNACTDDSCDEVGDACINANNANACDDGLFCTVSDACTGGLCTGPARDCGDSNACTDDSCNEAGDVCINADNADPCDDGLFCTVSDACAGGVCTGAARDCGDANVCTDDVCDEGTAACSNPNNTAACDDGLFCTATDSCSAGACVGSGNGCDDANACTDDTCIEVGALCLYANNAAACDDSDACTTLDTCSGGVCVGGPALVCDDANICTDDSCSPSLGCVFDGNGISCDDGLFCTLNDRCRATVCSGAARDCGDGNICTSDFCDEAGSACGSAFNTVECDDGDACTVDDRCSGGSCVPGAAMTCDDFNVCTDEACDPSVGCQFFSNSLACDDADPCTPADTCVAGACQGSGSLCGNGIGDGGCGETCDDGNIADGDGCSGACQLELRAELSLAKVDDFDPVLPGGLLTYTLAYSNSGEAPLTGVVVSDLVDPSTTFFAAQPAPDDGTQDRWTIGALTPGQSGSIQVTVVAGADLGDGDILLNAAEIAADDGTLAQATESTAVSASVSTALLRVDVAPYLASSRAPGSLIYAVFYRNEGSDTAVAATLALEFPAGMTFGGATLAPASQSQATASWSLGDLEPGARGGFVVAARVTSGLAAGTSLAACAQLSGLAPEGALDGPGLHGGSCATANVIGQCDLWFAKTHEPVATLPGVTGAVLSPAATAPVGAGGDALARASVRVLASRLSGKQRALVMRAVDPPHTATVAGNRNARAGGGVSYSIRYKNITVTNSLDVTVADAVTLTLIAPAPASRVGNSLHWDNLVSPSGAVALRGVVDPAAAPGTLLEVAAQLTDDAAAIASGSFSTLVLDDTTPAAGDGAPLVSVAGVRNARAAAAVSFSVRYSHAGDSNALVLDLPAGLSVSSTSPPADATGDATLAWNDLHAPSGSIAIRGELAPDLAPGTALTLSATLTNDGGESATGGFTTTVLEPRPDTVDAPPTLVGTDITYELRWLAPCQDGATLEVRDRLPADLELVTASAQRGFVSREAAGVAMAFPSTPAGAPQVARLFSRVAADPAPGTLVVNEGEATFAAGVSRDADLFEVPDLGGVDATPRIDILGRTTVRDGRAITLSVRAAGLAPGARVVVAVPAELVPTSIQPEPSEVAGNVFTWTNLQETAVSLRVRGDIVLGDTPALAAYVTTTAAVRNPDGKQATTELHTLATILRKPPKPPVVRPARFSLSGQRWVTDGGRVTLVARYHNVAGSAAIEMALPEQFVADAVYPETGTVNGNIIRWPATSGASGKVSALVHVDFAGDSSEIDVVTSTATLTLESGEVLSRSRGFLVR
ncbi:MAG: DUF11 domain-containing protein [Deltaproteobacteria bacterium]|nr:DUF11 domain-containing protein [Deltaproteobacteria bacterium]